MEHQSIFHKQNGHTPGTSDNPVERQRDFVACFDHSRVVSEDRLRLEEHVNRPGCKIFSMVDSSNNPVKIIGTEEEDDPNFEYVLAFHDRRTREVQIKPVSLLHFQPKQNVTEEFLLGKRNNFTGDHNDVTRENYREKQQSLIMEFGNSKRRKILEASLRRRVGDDTLESLGTSMLNGVQAAAKLVAETVDGKHTLNLSMLKAPESMVLPSMNLAAKHPSEVYSQKQFLGPDDIDLLGADAAQFFAENDTVQKMVDRGVPQFAAKLVVQNLKDDVNTFILSMKIVAWAKIYKHITDKKYYLRVNLTGINLPPAFITHYVQNFTDGPSGGRSGPMCYKLTSVLRNKLCAHLLCLMLLFSSGLVLPLGPLKTEIGVSESDAKKLLESMGCLISDASKEEITLYRTTKLARLVGPNPQNLAGSKRRNR